MAIKPISPQPSEATTSRVPQLTPEEKEQLLRKRIADLQLTLEGSRLENVVRRLHQELDAAGIDFKPPVYLSDEWGCPNLVPIIGVPFYLADERLRRIEEEMMEGIEAETDEEVLSYLRHEAGHAFNYAYKLFETEEWGKIFGPFSRPYQDAYQPNPFSDSYVRHISGWYAQKHPDEDFAETFAVWLSPESNWREAYRGWSCIKKLEYVGRIVERVGKTPPPVTADGFKPGAEELNVVIHDHYQAVRPTLEDVPAYFDGTLRDIFQKRAPKNVEAVVTEIERFRADKFLSQKRRLIIKEVAYWTGLEDRLIRSLLNHFIDRCRVLELWVNPAKLQETVVKVTTLMTTLCMNRLYKGDFILK